MPPLFLTEYWGPAFCHKPALSNPLSTPALASMVLGLNGYCVCVYVRVRAHFTMDSQDLNLEFHAYRANTLAISPDFKRLLLITHACFQVAEALLATGTCPCV